MSNGKFSLSTNQRLEFIDITAMLEKEIAQSGEGVGVCLVFNPHTTAGLTINEGADPSVQEDIIRALQKMVPQDQHYQHLEGNSPAHIMASMMGSSVTVLVEGGHLQLGAWQKVFFCEFDGPRTRKVLWRLV